jgi:hypothetical protein
MSPFRQHYDSFNPETLAVLEISFNETWTELQRNDNGFDQASMRTAVADLVMRFASQGESDPQKIKELVLAELQSRPNGRETKEAPRRGSLRGFRFRRIITAANAPAG